MFKEVKKLKRLEKYFIALTTLAAFAFLAAVASYAGIVNTKHDLSTAGTGTIKATAVSEKCVFCHTPHSKSAMQPLWNHELSAAPYTVLGPPLALEARLTTPGPPDGSSKLCLGCHDGTVAVGLVLNTPGRGSTHPTAMTMTGVTGVTAECPSGGCIPTFATGYLGTNLTGKHLVSIEFNSGLVTAKSNKCSLGEASIGLVLPPAGDAVKLKQTDHSNGFAGSTTPRTGIQCRTCHDPHDDTIKCFLVKGTCTACPCPPTDNYDALCNTCHYSPCP